MTRSAILGFWMALAALPLAFLAQADPAPGIELAPNVDDAGAPVQASAAGYAPDPAALMTRHQWVLDLRYRSGKVTFGGARRVNLAKALGTPRAMGRFAVELYVGRQLLDRVRFDFPLLGADELAGAPRRWDSPPSFEQNLSTQAAVMIPHSERATRVLLVDRASGRSWVLPWPMVTRADTHADAGSGED